MRSGEVKMGGRGSFSRGGWNCVVDDSGFEGCVWVVVAVDVVGEVVGGISFNRLLVEEEVVVVVDVDRNARGPSANASGL